MNHIVEMVGVVAAVIIWGGLSAMFLRRQIKRQLVALARHARTTPFRTLLGALAVGVAIAYGGTKYSYVDNGDGTVTLLTVTNTLDSTALEIPSNYVDKVVTALADGFCTNSIAYRHYESVKIPATVTSIGAHFFGYGTESNQVIDVEVDADSEHFAVTAEGVLYARESGEVVYAKGGITTVQFEPMGGEGAFGPCWFPAGVSTNLPSCTLTNPGYAFVGWATVENGALSYKDGGKLDAPAKDTQMTLYAIWVKSGCYGLAFDPGVEGASWSMVYQHVATNAVDKINLCTFQGPDGKSFAGWAKTEIDGEPTADPRRYDDGVLIFNLAAEKALVVLRAIWQ